MADRPIFVPCPEARSLVKEVIVSFRWNAGMATSQKRKNVAAIHEAAASRGLTPLLEVSTKSDEHLGRMLSAFNLKITFEDRAIALESAFQGSKVFEKGGPFRDLYAADARAAKSDPRIRNSGALTAFRFGRTTFPTTPKTCFYDWLYLQAVGRRKELVRELHRFAGFTDIEFNPKRSINCQARSCATIVALDDRGLLDECLESPGAFIHLLGQGDAEQPDSIDGQAPLFVRRTRESAASASPSAKREEDNRTSAIGLARYAREYFDCALAANEVVGRRNPVAPAPVLHLLAHSIELSLKSYLRYRDASLEDLRKLGHDLERCWSRAANEGLVDHLVLSPEEMDCLRLLTRLHSSTELRYIQVGARQFPVFSHLQALCEKLINSISQLVGYAR